VVQEDGMKNLWGNLENWQEPKLAFNITGWCIPLSMMEPAVRSAAH
jgi:hypothetical protein